MYGCLGMFPRVPNTKEKKPNLHRPNNYLGWPIASIAQARKSVIVATKLPRQNAVTSKIFNVCLFLSTSQCHEKEHKTKRWRGNNQYLDWKVVRIIYETISFGHVNFYVVQTSFDDLLHFTMARTTWLWKFWCVYSKWSCDYSVIDEIIKTCPMSNKRRACIYKEQSHAPMV